MLLPDTRDLCNGAYSRGFKSLHTPLDSIHRTKGHRMLRNAPDRYGAVTKTFHWLTAVLIVAVIPLGVLADGAPYDTNADLARKVWLFSAHKTVGVTIFATALLRILWALTQTKPAPLHPDRKTETLLANTVHWLLYGSLVLVPLTGWITHAAQTGFAPIWWSLGQSLPFVPKSQSLASSTATLHMIFERVMALSIALHILGALKHRLIDHDATLARIWIGQARAGSRTTQRSKTRALALALFVWGVALGLGGALGLFAQTRALVPVATLEPVNSGWQVTDGALTLTITQFENEITGSFTEWTADIRYDPMPAPKPSGTVSVRIATASLMLGTVTDQALGPDFLAPAQFPTATYDAQIMRVADGYEARGTLSLRGTQVPVTFPFALRVNNDRAEMLGRLTLDRRDFGIGATMTDAANLGFDVALVIALNAVRVPQD